MNAVGDTVQGKKQPPVNKQTPVPAPHQKTSTDTSGAATAPESKQKSDEKGNENTADTTRDGEEEAFDADRHNDQDFIDWWQVLDQVDEKPGVATDATQGTSDISIRMNLVDGAKTISEAFFVKLTIFSRDQRKLSDLRTQIASSADRKNLSRLPFCSKGGATVPDTFTIQEYITVFLEEKGPGNDIMNMYLKKDSSNVAQDTPKQSSQLNDPLALATLKGSFNTTAFKLLTGTFAKIPADLEEQEWSVISENNALCYGTSIAREKQGDKLGAVRVERARKPAFRLKQRHILSDTLTSTSATGVTHFLRIPDYQVIGTYENTPYRDANSLVADQSYVSEYTTQGSLQSSLATSSFSEFDVAISGGGSPFGVSVDAKASYGQSSESKKTSDSQSKTKQVTLAYNFPRVNVFLDEDGLELSTQCKEALSKVQNGTKQDWTRFLELFGEFFSTRVQLGGRLFATEQVKDESAASVEETARRMKAAAAVSFSGWGAHGSVETSGASGQTDSKSQSTSSSSAALTSHANGGDTLLCNKPDEWCPTVAYYYNWRITKQDNVATMVDLLVKFSGYEGLKELISNWEKESNPAKISKAVKPLGFYLFGTGEADMGCYNRTLQTKHRTLADGIKALNASKGSIIIDADDRAAKTECAMMPWPMSSPFDFKYMMFLAETADGRPVDSICYQRHYRVKLDSGSYITWDVRRLGKVAPGAEKTGFLMTTPEKGPMLLFRDAKEKEKEGAVVHGAHVTMHFVEVKDAGRVEWDVHVALQAKAVGDDRGDIYLMATRSAGDINPIPMRIGLGTFGWMQ